MNIIEEKCHIIETNLKKQDQKKEEGAPNIISENYFRVQIKHYLYRLKLNDEAIKNRFQRIDQRTRKLYPTQIKFSNISYELSKFSSSHQTFHQLTFSWKTLLLRTGFTWKDSSSTNAQSILLDGKLSSRTPHISET